MPETPRISFEFFPPRTADQRALLENTWQQLAPLRPEYLSVTFGAGGSTLDATRETVEALAATTDVPIAPHISCMAHSETMLRNLLERYRDGGIDRLVVLRGDRPEGVSHGVVFRPPRGLLLPVIFQQRPLIRGARRKELEGISRGLGHRTRPPSAGGAAWRPRRERCGVSSDSGPA